MSKFNGRSYIDTTSRMDKIKRLVWSIVWYILFRTTPRWTLNWWRLFLLRIFGATIGKGSRVLPSCKVFAPWNLTMGSYSVIGDDVDCYSVNKIIIGSRVTISQRSFLCGASHDIASLGLPLVSKPIIIEDYVWICSECFISLGSHISKGSVIAARSVLTKDTDTWSVYAGNPAKLIKKRLLDKSEEQI